MSISSGLSRRQPAQTTPSWCPAASRTAQRWAWMTAATAGLLLVGCVPGAGGRGDGGSRNNNNEDSGPPEAGLIVTVAGTGVAGFSGDGGAAADAQLNTPIDVLVRDSGDIVVLDFNNNRVRTLAAETGFISTLAGTGESEGENAIFQPAGIVFENDGDFFVAAWGEHHVYRYRTDGSRELFIGSGTAPCDAITVAPVTNFPRSIGFLGDGTLLIAEQGCHRIRQVSPEGAFDTFAGTGEAGYFGDFGPAIEARFNAGADMAAPTFGFGVSPEDPPDEIFVADTANHVIREINLRNGEVRTFAGTGEAGFADGPPREATFDSPVAVVTHSDHSVWVVDRGNHAIRRIDSLATQVTTVAGTGQAGYNGDNIPPEEAQLNSPSGVFVTSDGGVYIADSGNHRIRQIRFGAGP